MTRARWPGDQGAILPGPGREAEEIETLARWTAEAERLRGATVGPALLLAPAPDAIVGFARDVGVDLLVLASHGRKGMQRLVLGSVAEAVLRAAPCPVLIVRRDEPPARADAAETGGMPA